MRQATCVLESSATVMVGCVNRIGWTRIMVTHRQGRFANLAFMKLAGLATESTVGGRSGATRNDERRYADADRTWQTTL